MKKSLFISGAALISIAVPALAATQAPAPKAPTSQGAAPQMHHQMRDVTRAEVEAKVAERFAQLDTNKDGVVTREELAAQRAKQREQRQAERFSQLDKDGNGAISREEFTANRGPRDGRPAFAAADGAKRPGPDARKEKGRGPEGFGGVDVRGGKRHHGMMAGRMGDPMLMKADTDKDGKITLADARQAALAQFDKVDANKDGVITASERMEHFKQMRDQRKDRSPTPPAAPKA